MITHDEVRKELLLLNDKVDRNAFQNEYAIIDEYITQQEKKDKLLELYRDIERYAKSNWTDKAFMIRRTKEEISKLESELK